MSAPDCDDELCLLVVDNVLRADRLMVVNALNSFSNKTSYRYSLYFLAATCVVVD